ncbi:MAG: purple acid phosphatase family protein [Hyphomonadaceae bacterium]
MRNEPLCTRRALLGAGVCLGAAPAALAQEPSLSFLVIGDWGEHSDGEVAVAGAMARVAAELNTAFVVSTGDNFYSSGVESVDDPQWTETFEQVFSAASLQTPWYAVLGNHDYRGSVAAEMNYTIQSPRWRMPARYWQQDFAAADGGASFFFLDTFPLTHLPLLRARVPVLGDSAGAHAQLAWLERALASSPARWKFVVGHHPIVSSGAHGGAPALYHHVRPLLLRYGVAAYFNGHDHDLEYLRDGRLSYICSGAGSEVRRLRRARPQSVFGYDGGVGFASCSIAGATMQLRFHGGDGAELYASTLAIA